MLHTADMTATAVQALEELWGGGRWTNKKLDDAAKLVLAKHILETKERLPLSEVRLVLEAAYLCMQDSLVGLQALVEFQDRKWKLQPMTARHLPSSTTSTRSSVPRLLMSALSGHRPTVPSCHTTGWRPSASSAGHQMVHCQGTRRQRSAIIGRGAAWCCISYVEHAVHVPLLHLVMHHQLHAVPR